MVTASQRQLLNGKVHFILTTLLSFFIPLYPKILPLLIVLLTVNWLSFPNGIKSGFSVIRSSKSLIALIALYLIYLIGLIYTSNFKFAFEELETKLSFIIFPLVFSSHINNDEKNIDWYLKAFINGCGFYALFCFGQAVYYYLNHTPNPDGIIIDSRDLFYYTNLSRQFHPTYTAMYSLLAIFSFYHLQSRSESRLKFFDVVQLLLLISFVILLSSKAGWISLAVVMLMIGFDMVRNKRTFTFLLTAGIVTGLFVLLNTFRTSEYAQRLPKMESIQHSIEGKDERNNVVTTGNDGSARRIFVWKASLSVIKDHWLTGVGTGDSKDKLLEKYAELKMQSELENKLNSHNQFFTTAISFGVFGLVLFLLCFYFPLVEGFKQNNLLLLAFILIIGLNCLFESIFERQDGVIFFAFFFVIFNLFRSKNFFIPGS